METHEWLIARCVALLSLGRAVPLLQASGCAVTDQVRQICEPDARVLLSPDVTPETQGVFDTLMAFRAALDGHDSELRDYHQSHLVGVATEVINPDVDRSVSVMRIQTRIKESWGKCDAIVHRRNAWREEPFRSIKTTLVGVEWAWMERDEDVLIASNNIETGFRQRFALAREPVRWQRRIEICQRVVALASWQ